MTGYTVRGPGGRAYGTVSGQVYTSYRKAGQFCRRYHGWGIQLDILNQLKRAGIRQIVIVVDGLPMVSSIDDWDRYARIGVLNPDYGEQAFLEECHFRS